MNQQPAQPGLFIGMDWADQKHDVYVIDRNGKGVHRVLEHSAENIEAWRNVSTTLRQLPFEFSDAFL